MRQRVVATLLFTLAASANAAAETVSIPVTASHERLVVALARGDVTVIVGSDDAIRLSADCDSFEDDAAPEQGTFRSLRSSRTLPNTVVGDDTIAIRTSDNAPRCDVALTVPGQLELHTRVNGTGGIHVDGWQGSVLAWSADGDVSVTNHAGHLSVTAMNGDAAVSLAAAGIEADSAVTSANGTLTFTVGDAAIPAIRAQARWGDIRTDIDVEFEEVIEAGSTWFVTDRTADQPLLTLRNLNADIVIRRGVE